VCAIKELVDNIIIIFKREKSQNLDTILGNPNFKILLRDIITNSIALHGKNKWYHTKHTVNILLGCCDASKIIASLENKLIEFKHMQDFLTVSLVEDQAFFTLNDAPVTSRLSILAGVYRTFGVTLREGDGYLQAFTNSGHPLIGARRWWVEVVGHSHITLNTEAYEVNNNLAAIGDFILDARADAKKMWSDYLLATAEAVLLENKDCSGFMILERISRKRRVLKIDAETENIYNPLYK